MEEEKRETASSSSEYFEIQCLKSDPRFRSVIANDPISHTFWHFYEPEKFRDGVEPDMAQRLGKTIPNFYRHNDRYLARLRQLIDPDTVVMVVSDHGFEASGDLPKTAQPNGIHERLKNWYEGRTLE